MATFAVITETDNEKLEKRISEVFSKEDVHRVDVNLILIHSEKDAIAKNIFERIEGEGDFPCRGENGIGRFVIFSVTSYYGIHFKSMWDWLDNKV